MDQETNFVTINGETRNNYYISIPSEKCLSLDIKYDNMPQEIPKTTKAEPRFKSIITLELPKTEDIAQRGDFGTPDIFTKNK